MIWDWKALTKYKHHILYFAVSDLFFVIIAGAGLNLQYVGTSQRRLCPHQGDGFGLGDTILSCFVGLLLAR